MDDDNFAKLLISQREYFDAGATRSYSFRFSQLKRLLANLKSFEQQLLDALATDLAKPKFEAYASEIAPLYNELNYALKQLKKWVKPTKVATPWSLFSSKSSILPVPLGCVLIIAPWNYPIQLLLAPLIGAIAAGNCVVLKPSELTPTVAVVLDQLIRRTFGNKYVTLVNGDGAKIVPQLIRQGSFNHVFFTGSPTVGQLIATQCAARLIPYTLELGGKSPAIVDASASLAVTAKRIVWSKFFNAGQTCIAPDYLLVHHSIYPQLIEELKQVIVKFELHKIGAMAKIITPSHLERLRSYFLDAEIVFGGEIDAEKSFINATLLINPQMDSPIMTQEIFGPLLPILSYANDDELIAQIRQNRYPLSCYVYSQSQSFIDKILAVIESGSCGVNIGLYQFANHKLPFGGVMHSGQRQYHGEHSFKLFSHAKAVIQTRIIPDVFIKYPPYSTLKSMLYKLFSRW